MLAAIKTIARPPATIQSARVCRLIRCTERRLRLMTTRQRLTAGPSRLDVADAGLADDFDCDDPVADNVNCVATTE